MAFDVKIPSRKDIISVPFVLDGDERASLTKDIRHVIISTLNKGYIVIVHSPDDVDIIKNYFSDIEQLALEFTDKVTAKGSNSIHIQFNMVTLSILRP